MKQLFAALLCLTLSLTAYAGGAPASQRVVVIVSPDNPVTSLTRHQVSDLFLGRTRHYPDGRPALPVDQPESSSSREAFNSEVLGRSAAQVRAHWAKVIFTGRGRPPVNAADDEAVKRLVAADAGAIGYIDRDLVDERVVVVELQ